MVGDGAMQLNGLNELITIAKYWKEWSDPRLIVLVLNNRDLNQVTWEQRAMTASPKFEDSQNIPDFRYADYAKSVGLDGIRVDNPESIGAAWDQALAAKTPFVVEMFTDPEVPTLPPRITPEEAKSFYECNRKGRPERPAIHQTIGKRVGRHLFAAQRLIRTCNYKYGTESGAAFVLY